MGEEDITAELERQADELLLDLEKAEQEEKREEEKAKKTEEKKKKQEEKKKKDEEERERKAKEKAKGKVRIVAMIVSMP